MAYDKKTGTITTNGDKQQFGKDVLSHFAHVEAQVNAELAKEATDNKNMTLKERLKSLSRPTKISIVFFVAWTLYVIFRTSGYYELLGMDLQRWDADYFFLNWLVVPVFIFVLYKAVRWALRKK